MLLIKPQQATGLNRTENENDSISAHLLCSSVHLRPFIAARIFSLSASVWALPPRFVRPLPGVESEAVSEGSLGSGGAGEG